jgi:hypothetical protein
MRNWLWIGLLIASPAVAGWTGSDQDMRAYLDNGYEIVGFATMEYHGRTYNSVTVYRYVLQKGPSVAMCTEKTETGTGNEIETACHDLT